MRQSRYQPLEQPPPEQADKPNEERRETAWLAVALLLAAAVVGIRLLALHGPLGNMAANVLLLKAAMRAAGGVTNDNAADVLQGRTPTGVQARALSLIARTVGQSATAESWLVYGLSDPSSAYLSQFELCLLYWNEGQRARARETCRNTRDSALYWLNRGYQADQRSEPEEALAYFQMAAATDPDLTAAWHQLGRALFAAGRHDEAVLAFERLMVLDATPPADVYDALSASYLHLNNPTMARDVLDRGLLFYPDQRAYYLAMADSFRAEENLDAADSWYARMLQRWPYDAQAWAARGATAVAAGRLGDAIIYYREAAANQPTGVGYWMNLASTAAATDDVRLATEAYERAMALRPDDPAIWLHAGRFLVETEQVEQARTVFEHILVLQPDNSEAASQLAALLAPSRQ